MPCRAALSATPRAAGMSRSSDAAEKKAYGIIKHIPVIGQLYSIPRAFVYLGKGQRCEAARSAAGMVLGGPLVMAADEVAKAIQRDNGGRHIGKKTLKHATSREAGQGIERTRTMRCGVDGVLGRGIYFAETEEATKGKALHHGAMVTAEVDLGKCLTVSEADAIWRMLQDGGFGHKKLAKAGISSVCCDFNGGREYCVFDPARVKILKVTYSGTRRSAPY